MIRLFKNKLNLRKKQYQSLSINLIEGFINCQLKDNIDLVCKYKNFTENCVDNYANMLDWELILEYQKLPAYFKVNHLMCLLII